MTVCAHPCMCATQTLGKGGVAGDRKRGTKGRGRKGAEGNSQRVYWGPRIAPFFSLADVLNPLRPTRARPLPLVLVVRSPAFHQGFSGILSAAGNGRGDDPLNRISLIYDGLLSNQGALRFEESVARTSTSFPRNRLQCSGRNCVPILHRSFNPRVILFSVLSCSSLLSSWVRTIVSCICYGLIRLILDTQSSVEKNSKSRMGKVEMNSVEIKRHECSPGICHWGICHRIVD